MSNILKGILNEVSPHDYDSDWDYQDAVARSGKSRSSYRPAGHNPDDTSDADIEYSKKMYQLSQKQKRDSDHDRLASGTNEGAPITTTPGSIEPGGAVDNFKQQMANKTEIDYKKKQQGVVESDDPWGDQGNFAGDKPVNLGGVSIKNIQTGDTVKYLGQPSKVVAMSKDRKHSRITITKGIGTVTQDVLTSDLQQLGRGTAIEEDNNTRMRMNDYYDLADAIQEKLRNAIRMGNKELIQKLNKERDELDARVKQYGLMPESQLDELDTKLGLYKIAAGKDATTADKAGDYTRGHKRFKGIMKATEKEFANDARKKKDADEKKSAISQGINEFSPGATGPKGPKDYGQPNSSRYIGKDKFVVGTTNNYVLTATVDKWGLEWDEDDEIWFLDSPGAAHIADASEGEIELPPPREQRNQIHDLVTDYLNEHNSQQLQQVAAYFGHTPDGEMATNESISKDRFNSKQEVINHFVKNGKSAAAGSAAWERGYRGSSNKPIELKKPPQRSYHDELDDKRYSSTFENLGNQLKPTSFEELVKAKLAIARQIEAEAEAFERDLYKNNTVQKAQQGLRREFEPTPVAQPGEKHSVLKARLVQLDSAIQKQKLLDKLVDRLERRGILTPAMQNDADTTMNVRYGAKDNYESLNKKLDNAISTLQSRLNIRKLSGLKEVHDERDDYDNPRQGRDYGKGNLFVDPGSTEFPKEKHLSDPDVEVGRPKKLKGVSKALPADAFGRTSGKIPDSARPTSNPDPFPPAKILKNHEKWIYPPKSNKSVDEADMNRRGFLGQAGKVAGAGHSEIMNAINKGRQGVAEEQHSCPHCGGEMVSEELMNEKKDACYYKVKSRYKVWPSAYASGALVKCRNKGASNWGNGGKKNESSILEGINRADESLHDWFNKEKWVRMDTKGNIKGPCAKEPGEGKPKCLPQSKAHNLGKKGRASAAQRKRREDPNPERSGKAINVDTKKQSNENIDENWKKKLGAAALAGSMALGAAGAHADTRRVTPDGQGGFIGG
jgi:hypothetical protein